MTVGQLGSTVGQLGSRTLGNGQGAVGKIANMIAGQSGSWEAEKFGSGTVE